MSLPIWLIEVDLALSRAELPCSCAVVVTSGADLGKDGAGLVSFGHDQGKGARTWSTTMATRPASIGTMPSSTSSMGRDAAGKPRAAAEQGQSGAEQGRAGAEQGESGAEQGQSGAEQG